MVFDTNETILAGHTRLPKQVMVPGRVLRRTFVEFGSSGSSCSKRGHLAVCVCFGNYRNVRVS